MTDDIVGRLRAFRSLSRDGVTLIDAADLIETQAARIEALEAERAQVPARIDRAFEMGWRMATCSRDRNSFDEMKQAIANYRTALTPEAPHAD